jgi:ParB family chromosome partitioning protein
MSKTISVGDKTLEVESMMIPISELIPNYRQPRLRNTLDLGLRKSIRETKGLVQPLLAERITKDVEELVEGAKKRYKEFGDTVIPEFLETAKPKYLIIDGERRWANSVRILSEDAGPEYLKLIPCDVISQTLSEKDRYILWVSIHRMRKEWKAMEKEAAARHLMRLIPDPASAANILGVTVRSLQKLIDTYEFAQRMKKKVGPKAISYARETLNLAKKIRTEEVENAIVDKVNKGLIRDPVSIRKIREIAKYPEAMEAFLKPNETIESALAKVPKEEVSLSKSARFKESIVQFRKIVSNYPWREIQAWKGDPDLLKEIDYCISLLQDVKKAVA